MTDVGILDHQLIYFNRTFKRIKYNMHNQIQFRSYSGGGEIITNENIVAKSLLMH